MPPQHAVDDLRRQPAIVGGHRRRAIERRQQRAVGVCAIQLDALEHVARQLARRHVWESSLLDFPVAGGFGNPLRVPITMSAAVLHERRSPARSRGRSAPPRPASAAARELQLGERDRTALRTRPPALRRAGPAPRRAARPGGIHHARREQLAAARRPAAPSRPATDRRRARARRRRAPATSKRAARPPWPAAAPASPRRHPAASARRRPSAIAGNVSRSSAAPSVGEPRRQRPRRVVVARSAARASPRPARCRAPPPCA